MSVVDTRRKLNEQQVLEIRALNAEGVSQVKLAKRYGVTQQAISAILHRVVWKWL